MAKLSLALEEFLGGVRLLLLQRLMQASVCSSAEVIKGNLEKGLVTLAKQIKTRGKGEDAAYEVFKEGSFDAICSDDKRFIKRLRFFDIPYITPSVFIVMLIKKREITLKEAHDKLIALSSFISDDEYNAVKIILENWREQ